MIIIPNPFEIIPLDEYDKLCKHFSSKKITLIASPSFETIFNYYVDECMTISYKYFMDSINFYLAFPYVQEDSNSDLFHFRKQASERLGFVLECLSNSVQNSLSFEIATQISKSLQEIKDIIYDSSKLTLDEILNRNPHVVKEVQNGNKYVKIDSLPPAEYIHGVLEMPESLAHKHLFLFLEELGIIEHLINNWVITGEDETKDFHLLNNNDTQLAKILAIICKYDDPAPLRLCIKDNKLKAEYKSDKAMKTVNDLIHNLRIKRRDS